MSESSVCRRFATPEHKKMLLSGWIAFTTQQSLRSVDHQLPPQRGTLFKILLKISMNVTGTVAWVKDKYVIRGDERATRNYHWHESSYCCKSTFTCFSSPEFPHTSFSLIAPKDQPLPLSLATIRTTIIINATVVGRPTNRMCRWLQIVSSMSSFILRLRTRIILSLHKQLQAIVKSLKPLQSFWILSACS